MLLTNSVVLSPRHSQIKFYLCSFGLTKTFILTLQQQQGYHLFSDFSISLLTFYVQVGLLLSAM